MKLKQDKIFLTRKLKSFIILEQEDLRVPPEEYYKFEEVDSGFKFWGENIELTPSCAELVGELLRWVGQLYCGYKVDVDLGDTTGYCLRYWEVKFTLFSYTENGEIVRVN